MSKMSVEPEPFLTPGDLERITKRNIRFWARKRREGDGPYFYRVGARIRYRISDVEAWLAERKYSTTAEARMDEAD